VNIHKLRARINKIYSFGIYSMKHAFKLLALLIYGFTLFAQQPQQIIEAWQTCQLRSEMDANCISVGHQAIKLRDLIELLQTSPQGFGLEIMQLQNRLLNSNLSVSKKIELEKELNLRLAIVGWLESPK
jgi:hypothetical protein